jgi:tRNA A37 threonylcarbamoyladenosine biosynthesis protein TsaE
LFELLKANTFAQFKTRCLFERLPSTVYTMTKPIIIIEGNIGAGKSTLSKQLAASMRYALFQEPTTGNPYLEKYYSQPKVYALP